MSTWFVGSTVQYPENVTLDLDALSSDSNGWSSFIDSVKRYLGRASTNFSSWRFSTGCSTAHPLGAVSDLELVVTLLNKIIERHTGSLWDV